VVGHSTLTIPCGPGYDVPADWYFPTGPDPPQGVIWLQHGFLAQGPWYSTTAATLAKKTNSIVVAPSITSNFLQCDALLAQRRADGTRGRVDVRRPHSTHR
jgi:hypothetical protein